MERGDQDAQPAAGDGDPESADTNERAAMWRDFRIAAIVTIVSALLIGFLWLGSGLMVLGGLFAITDRRYRAAVRQTQQAAAQPATGTA